jgi:hypothetical protein
MQLLPFSVLECNGGNYSSRFTFKNLESEQEHPYCSVRPFNVDLLLHVQCNVGVHVHRP